MLVSHSLLFATIVISISLSAYGEETLFGNSDYLYPAPVNSFELEGGISNKDNSLGKNNVYHKVSYKGNLLESSGVPFKYASGLSLLTPKLEKSKGDVQDITFNYEGGGKLDGAIFSATKTAPIEFRGLGDSLRGSAIFGGNIKNKTYQAAVGLETKPWHLDSISKAGVSNWLVFGLNGQHQEATDTAANDSNMSLFTYRAFMGKAFGWSKCADTVSIRDKVVVFIFNQVPNFAEATVIEEKILKIPVEQRTRVQEVFNDAVYETRKMAASTVDANNANWRKSVEKIVLGDTDAITDCPTISAYAELSGWYTISGEDNGSKSKNLFIATVDYWPLKKNDNTLLRLRYENGYERVAPTIKKDQLTISVVIRF